MSSSSTPSPKCNLCESRQIDLYGYLGLNLVYQCRLCGNRFVETVEKIEEEKIKVKAYVKKRDKTRRRQTDRERQP